MKTRLIISQRRRHNIRDATDNGGSRNRNKRRNNAVLLWSSSLLLFLQFCNLGHAQIDYDALAANFGTTVEEVFALGGQLDDLCLFNFNATPANCNEYIGRLTLSDAAMERCGCFNFCNGELAGCFPAGGIPDFFTCDIRNVVAGCHFSGGTPVPLPTAEDDEAQKCPAGMMCTREKMKSCDEIRQSTIDLGFGDVWAGIRCPGRHNREWNNLQNCKRGHYCPNSTTMIKCPAGYFCPTKTAFPELVCSDCEEGQEDLPRGAFGIIVGAFCLTLVVCLVVYEGFKRYNSGVLRQLSELKNRNLDYVGSRLNAKKRQERLQRLEPKLQIIESRIKSKTSTSFVRANGIKSPTSAVTPSSSTAGTPSLNQRTFDPRASSKALSTRSETGKIRFDARRLFDLMDFEGNGELSYDAINHALELCPGQLREFTRRMNQYAKQPADTETITRAVFVKSFLHVLEQISHFEPTYLEAEQLFDEILQQPENSKEIDEITHESLFASPIAEFLDETKINYLIKRLRQRQEENHSTCMNEDPEQSLISVDSKPELSDMEAGGLDVSDNEIVKMSQSSPGIRLGESSSEEIHSYPRLGKHSSLTNVFAKRNSKAQRDLQQKGLVPFKFKRPRKIETISRDGFVMWYPRLLTEIINEAAEGPKKNADKSMSVDVTFSDLSLSVRVKNDQVTIVDKVSGRLQAGTMTALMGASGAGKTSLLNALCGRAFYGEVTGTVKVNGHETSIEEHAHAVGFVPQDDIVYAELTVRENFIFSGKFQLPSGTPMRKIEELADETLANLGLSRVMHSIVGDVTRRGVSGGERKRVNIGLELMAKPSFLCLDEPTSGLDANSALLVMESLKTLVENTGTTVCSVIHQPRKFIYELFDSLILLGIGGKMVYHGPVEGTENYFKRQGYVLPPGESIADWLIDISTGRLETAVRESVHHTPMPQVEVNSNGTNSTSKDEIQQKSQKLREQSRDTKKEESSIGSPPTRLSQQDDGESSTSSSTGFIAGFIAATSTNNVNQKPSSTRSSRFDATVQALEDAPTQEKLRREVLYKKWNRYFENLSEEAKQVYLAPEPYELPKKIDRPSAFKQLGFQLHRLVVVGRRNWLTKLIDLLIIVLGALLISFLDGTVDNTWSGSELRDIKYEFVAEPTNAAQMVGEFPKLFAYATEANFAGIQGYCIKMGVILAILIGLSALKAITGHRKEFFREAGSGYNVNSFTLAINIMVTLEHSAQTVIAALFSLWLRSSYASWTNFFVHFLGLSWIATSWALLFPLIIPAENVFTVAGFYYVLFSLLFSGGVAPVLYSNIYAQRGWSIFAGLLSPTRFFIEGISVAESRVLPIQSGFTNLGKSFQGEALRTASFQMLGLGLHDFGNITQQSVRGWYWGVLPAFCVGLTVRWLGAGLIHVSHRSEQAKKPITYLLRHDRKAPFVLFGFVAILIGLIVTDIWLLERQVSAPGYVKEPKN